MSTPWTIPTEIVQYAEDPSHIAWDTNFDSVVTMNGGVSLIKPLFHIARQPKNDIKSKSWYLKATNFNFQNIPTVITGITLKMTMTRQGRVTDDTIQLTHNGELIGDNKCSRSLNPVNVYGDSTDTWGISNLRNIIQDSTFGIVVRFRSHPEWPHSTTPILRGLELQIH